MSIHQFTKGFSLLAGLACSLAVGCAASAPMQPGPKAPDPDLTNPVEEAHAQPIRSTPEPELIYVHTDTKRAASVENPSSDLVVTQKLVAHQGPTN